MPSSRRCGKYVTRSEINARASRRAFEFGSLARNGLIGARDGVAPGAVAPTEGRAARGAMGGVIVGGLGGMSGATGRGAAPGAIGGIGGRPGIAGRAGGA